ncbi:MAG: tyrosine--tRNA ligase, partial [archaeon]
LKDSGGKIVKPVAVHHPLILGLQKPPVWPVPEDRLQELWSAMKMSKSVPNSAVFVHDSENEIADKLSKAFCPERETKFNPVLDWAKKLVFSHEKASLVVERQEKFGGTTEYFSYADLENDFAGGKLHPMDLKNAMGIAVTRILGPARSHFEKPKYRKMLEELEKLAVTR